MSQLVPQPDESGGVKRNDEVLELQVVRDPSRGGRPLHLTTKRFIRICKMVEQGESITEACRFELISYNSFRAHVVRNPSYDRRLKQALETREGYLKEFHIENIRKHAPRNVIASLWWLERRFPGEYALRKVDREGTAEALIGDKIPEERVLEYGRIMAEEAKKLSA